MLKNIKKMILIGNSFQKELSCILLWMGVGRSLTGSTMITEGGFFECVCFGYDGW